MQTSKSTGLRLLPRTLRPSGCRMESGTPLNAVKASINANRANFTDFDSVKDAYVEFKRTENPTNDPRTRQVASVAHGGCRGGSFPRKHDRVQGPQTFDKCQKGLVPQSEVDKQTHIIDRHYSDAEFD
jgi:hypothetical protein